jgi:coatomer protein complex subunit alpha (xenin)
LAAAGAFDQATHLLSRQISVCAFAPLRPALLRIQAAAQASLPMLPGGVSLSLPLSTPSSAAKGVRRPETGLKLATCVAVLRLAYRSVTDGKFSAALQQFRRILHTVPLLVVDQKAQEREVADLVAICNEYVTAMRVEAARKEVRYAVIYLIIPRRTYVSITCFAFAIKHSLTLHSFLSRLTQQAAAGGDKVRAASLAAYFTTCKLQPMHEILGLRVAIKACYTANNFKSTAGFCRRILELVLSSNNAAIKKIVNPAQIQGVLKLCDQKGVDENDMQFDASQVGVIRLGSVNQYLSMLFIYRCNHARFC